MSWIEETDLPNVPEIFRALSLNSEALDVVAAMNEGLAFGSSTLDRGQEEAIATVVSVANHCRYGALTHSGFYRRHSGDSARASILLSDYTQASFPEGDRRMLDFALKVTTQPASLTRTDLEGLRAVGFADADILSIVLVTCLCNFMNRVATSLGVEAPPSFQRSAKSWLTGPATREAWLLGKWADSAPETYGPEGSGTLLELNSHQVSIPLSEPGACESAIAPQELAPALDL